MFGEFALSILMLVLTGVIHAVGLDALTCVMRLEERYEGIARIHPMSLRGFAATWARSWESLSTWAGNLVLCIRLHVPRSTETLRDPVYFSTMTYSAIGYGDAQMAEKWHLVLIGDALRTR